MVINLWQAVDFHCWPRTRETSLLLEARLPHTQVGQIPRLRGEFRDREPIMTDNGRLTTRDFENQKISEMIESREGKCRPFHSPLWQADTDKIRRFAPIEFIGRYMPGWFDTHSALRFINWPAIKRRETRSTHCLLVPSALWD